VNDSGQKEERCPFDELITSDGDIYIANHLSIMRTFTLLQLK
jgi:hypothetical protein